MSNFALFVELKARSGKEEEVAAILASARELVLAETGTVSWYAVRFDIETFAIFDTFEEDAGRDAHLAGKVAEALMARAEELFLNTPQMRQAEVLADKLAP